ncbi:subtilisin family serine protease [Okibacterium sp. HSC-33S16]|uniref:S8 family serine peptidase n=1 Tax=Okibacterium sp. HSC-33S16 TaxID=2910965 RepID=UPI00209DDA03|nr:S8 family serine peptidase [Okibacterium sp. HSC-33S16]MCP2030284.1 subtilisin family serine protease [Okibacterium sp. HSC-33S16]
MHSRRRILPAALATLFVFGTVSAGSTAAHADPVRDAQYWLANYGVSEAWNTTRGAGATIAIIDTGIANGPAEFNGAVVAGHDASGVGSADGRTPIGGADENPHGSWVASLAAGRGNGDGNGVLGTAPEANLISISVGFQSSGSTLPFADQIADAIHFAVDNGADVINMSLTTNTLDWPESWDEAFSYANENDVIVVAAAGNRGSGTEQIGAPATIPGVLVVAGVDPAGAASWNASSQGITLAVAAPSEELVGVSPDGTYVSWAGTSGASPIVAGIAALVRAKYPDMDAANVINRIIATATPAADQTAVPSPIYGYGYVNASRAVTADVPTVDANPMGDLAAWITQHRKAEAAPPEIPTDEGSVPTLPPLETSADAHNPFLPTTESLLYVSIPLAVFLGTATLVVLGAIGATRQIKRVAQK